VKILQKVLGGYFFDSYCRIRFTGITLLHSAHVGRAVPALSAGSGTAHNFNVM